MKLSALASVACLTACSGAGHSGAPPAPRAAAARETPAPAPTHAAPRTLGDDVDVTVSGVMATCQAAVRSAIGRLPDLGPLPPLYVSAGDETVRFPAGAATITLFEPTGSALCAGKEVAAQPRLYQPTPRLLRAVADHWFGLDETTATVVDALRSDDIGASYSLSAFTALLAMAPAPAAVVRAELNASFQQVPAPFGLASPSPAGSLHNTALALGKGPMVLTAIEDHLGADRMVEVLRHLVATRGLDLVSWRDVLAAVDAVAGADAARWARQWIARTDAPDLRMVDAHIAGGRFTTTLTQATTPPFDDLVVEIQLGTAIVRATVGATPVAVDVPVAADVDEAVLDPRSRLPRRFDPKTSATDPALHYRAPR